jgi:TonB family protein
MNHRSEGEIQAFLDDELTARERQDVAEHIMSCARCRGTHDELRQARSLFSDSIRRVDVEPPAPVLSTRRTVRLAAGSLVRAAVLVLVVAAAAVAAVPGSPVREWVVRTLERESPATRAGSSDAELAPVVEAAAGIAVEGTVRSATGAPIAFAHLDVVRDTVSGWTDEAGAFRLDGRPGDRWLLRATHPGYRAVETEVVLPETGDVTLDLTLDRVPGPSPAPLADFRPFRVAYTLPALLNPDEIARTIQSRYPPYLEERGAEGEAVLRLWLDEQGKVARSTLSTSSGLAELDALALGVARDMRFRPATNAGEPVRVIVLMPVRFIPPTGRADLDS